MPAEFTLVFRVIDLLGVVLNGFIGGTIARKRRFDVVGFAVLAITSALGGGLLRDTLLQAGRPVALTDASYIVCALIGAAIAFSMRLRGRPWRLFFPLADAVVLGAWAATGTMKSLTVGVDWVPAVCLGVATAVGGGMIRDVTAGRVPEVFGGNTLYAVPAILSATVVALGHALAWENGLTLVAATASGAALALLARRFAWTLPVHGDAMHEPARHRLSRKVKKRRPKTQGPAAS